MKTRIVHTKIWEDDWFNNIPRASRFLFIYFLTCPQNNICGIFELPDRLICFSTGVTQTELEQAKIDLKNKIHFHKNWVKIVKTEKYNNYVSNSKLQKALDNELALVPEEIITIFNGYDTSIHTSIHTPNNHKSKIKKKRGIVKGENEASPGGAVAEHLISVFNQSMGKNYTLTKKRQTLVTDRLKKFTASQLELACKKLGTSPFHTGKNDRGWIADPDWLFRNDENIDKSLNLEEIVQKPVRRSPLEGISYAVDQ